MSLGLSKNCMAEHR